MLAIWTDLLASAADLLNIEVPANGLFLAAFAVAFLLLLHFSVATSRLSEETKILAQEVARLDGELRAAPRGANGDGVAAAARSSRAGRGQPQSATRAAGEHHRPVGPERPRSARERTGAPRYGRRGRR